MKIDHLSFKIFAPMHTIYTKAAADNLMGSTVDIVVNENVKAEGIVVVAEVSDDGSYISMTLDFGDAIETKNITRHPANDYHAYSIGEQNAQSEETAESSRSSED